VRVLFLTHRLPHPPNRGDRIRSFQLLRHLKSFAEVDLVSFVHSADEASNADALASWTSSVRILRVPRMWTWIRAGICLPTRRPLTHLLLDAPSVRSVLGDIVRTRRPDVMLAFCSGMARFGVEPPLAGLPLVIDMVDVDSLKWRALARSAAPPMRWIYAREAACLARFEASVAPQAYANLVVNEREREALSRLAPGARIDVIQQGIDFMNTVAWPPPAVSMDVLFCGVMNYPPNEEGILWFAAQVWPLVRKRSPQARLRIVGAAPRRNVLALADRDNGIEVTGSVPDMNPYLRSAAVSIAPLLTARGVQVKVLESVCAGLPSVVTSMVAGGLPAEVLPACEVADTREAFASAIVKWLSLSPDERRAIVQQANLAELDWTRQLSPLKGILQAAASGTRTTSSSNVDRV
jgi:polysaccharide biosynthesis protein PslH